MRARLLLVGFMAASMASCQTPIMVDSEFVSGGRTARYFIAPPGGGGLKLKGSKENDLANAWVRVCNVKSGKEDACKDSLILDNVQLK